MDIGSTWQTYKMYQSFMSPGAKMILPEFKKSYFWLNINFIVLLKLKLIILMFEKRMHFI